MAVTHGLLLLLMSSCSPEAFGILAGPSLAGLLLFGLSNCTHRVQSELSLALPAGYSLGLLSPTGLGRLRRLENMDLG